jgi:hypothetical protein
MKPEIGSADPLLSVSVSPCLCGEFRSDFAFSLFRDFAFSNGRAFLSIG